MRNCSGPSPEAHTPSPEAPPSELADGPLRAWRDFTGRVAPPRLRRRLRGHSGRVCGHGKAPAPAGAFGSAFEVFQDVCQVGGVVAAELLEEVDFDVHWGFLSLSFPFVVPLFYQPPPPVSSPGGVSFATFLIAISYRTVRQRGPRFSYVHVTYPSGTYT